MPDERHHFTGLAGRAEYPGVQHHPVARWVHPDEFAELAAEADTLGFAGVLSGPLVRSSYRAGRLYAQTIAATSDSVS